MSDHVHTGFVAFMFAGISAVIFLNLWRMAAAKAAASERPSIAALGASAGALTQFGGGS